MADQAIFAEDRPQLNGLVGIAPVDGEIAVRAESSMGRILYKAIGVTILSWRHPPRTRQRRARTTTAPR